MALVADDPVAPQQVVGALVEGDAVGMVLVDLVVGHQVVHRVAVDDDAREFVVVGLVVDDPTVVHLAGDDDAVLLPGAVDGVLGDDQAVGTVVGVDAVDDVVAVGVALDDHVAGFVAVEAVPVVDELRVQQPAGGFRALEARVHAGGVLGDGDAIGLGVVVAEAGDGAVGDVQLAAAPGDQERAELRGRAEPGRGVVLLAPGRQPGAGDEQLAVVDQECAALLGQAEIMGLFADAQAGVLGHHDWQAGDVDARCGFGELVVGQGPGQVGRGDEAAFDEDRLGHAALAADPFAHALVAADEVLQGVLLEHAPDHYLAGGASVHLGFDGLAGVAGEVGQLGRVQVQLVHRGAGDGVVLGFLEAFGRLGRVHPRGAGQQHAEHQAAERPGGCEKVGHGCSPWARWHQKRQMKSTKARCMSESVPLP